MTTLDSREVASLDVEHAMVRTRLAELVRDLQRTPRSPSQAWGATFDAGLSRVDYPVGWGGLGVRPELQGVVDDALLAIGVPSNFAAHAGGIGVVAPVIAKFATEEQRARYLRNIFTCDEFWCQLFSEPDAGSDLASLRSTVVRDGDSWILNGHKVWTTMGHIAQQGLLLARSSTQESRHRGITCFVLDMATPGVEVRPLRQITGDAEFNEVFFTDVLVPDSARIGDVDGGWRVAMGTLMEERNAVNHVLDTNEPVIVEALRVWRASPDHVRTAVRRDRLADLYVQWEVCEQMRGRAVAKQQIGVPGPEGSLVKLRAGELNKLTYEFLLELSGADGMLYGSYALSQPANWLENGILSGDVNRAFLRARATTIEGGTNEVQRNTVGERLLGLPREPRPDHAPAISTKSERMKGN